MIRPGFFRRDVETTIRFTGGALVVAAFVLMLGWGYEQRQQAQQWREVACAYRYADLVSRARFLAAGEADGPCDRLESLGLGVQTSTVLAALPRKGTVTRQ
jgi:predicted negative regulator of RcsB-dependent stress response